MRFEEQIDQAWRNAMLNYIRKEKDRRYYADVEKLK